MPRRREQLINDKIYHIFNRGVRKNDIFLKDPDYIRWKDLLYWYLRYDYPFSMYLRQLKNAQENGIDHKEVELEIAELHSLSQSPVEIIVWTLMPNHFHLVLKQVVDEGIFRFLHRTSTAFSMYFNQKYEVSGSLLEGNFKSVLVETKEQFLHVCRYCHINPLTANLTTKETLLQYPWSSLGSYLNNNDEDPVLTKEHLLNHFGSLNELLEFTLAPFEEDEISGLKGLTHDDDLNWYRPPMQKER